MPRVIDAFAQFFDNNGDPLVDGWLRFLVSGTNNTDKDTFADINETVANANPLQLDAAGRCPNVFGTGAYRVISYTNDPILGAPATQIQQFDPVQGSASSEAFPSWDSSTTYNIPDIVLGDDLELYRSIINNNLGNDPTSSPTSWEQIEFEQIYNANRTYSQFERCIDSSGISYISLVSNNTGNTPSSSPSFWQRANLPEELLKTGRSEFAYISTTQISITGGGYSHLGTKPQVLLIDSTITHTITSPGTSQWQYIYLDDSAIVTAGTNILTASEVINSTTAPTYSNSKKGWYNGLDLCICAVYIDGSGNVEPFWHDGGDLMLFDDQQQDRSGSLSNVFSAVTLTLPEFCTMGYEIFIGSYVSAQTICAYRPTGSSSVIGQEVGTVDVASVVSTVIRQVKTDTSQQIDVRGNNNNTALLRIETIGWFFPSGM